MTDCANCLCSLKFIDGIKFLLRMIKRYTVATQMSLNWKYSHKVWKVPISWAQMPFIILMVNQFKQNKYIDKYKDPPGA